MSEFKGTKDALETVDFFDAMQNYRIADMANQERVIERFEDVKSFIRENFVPKKQNDLAPEMLEMLEETFKLTDKLQMPTEFEISQLRDKLFHLIKKATEL